MIGTDSAHLLKVISFAPMAVTIPPRGKSTGPKFKYNYHSLEIGESMVLPTNKKARINCVQSARNHAKRTGKVFAVRKDRLYRDEDKPKETQD